MRKLLNLWPLLLTASLSATTANPPGSTMPDMTRAHFQRMDCHNAYDLIAERVAGGTTTASADEIAFVKAYEAAAAAGKPCPAPPDALAQAAANRIVSTGDGLKRLAKFIDQDDPVAQFEGGWAILNDKMPGAEKSVGVQLIKQSSDQGYAPAQFIIAMLYVAGSVTGKADYAGGLPLLEKAAAQGHVDAMFHVGNIYKEGLAGRKDAKLAFDYYTRAAAQGHIFAAYLAFDMIQNGEGTKKDFVRAYKLARTMADQGEVIGAVLAASALLQQKDAKTHEDEVLYWFDKAIKEGDANIRAKVGELRPRVVAAYQRANAPPEYHPREFKACPMKRTCLVDRYSGYQSCTTNKDYWNDCDF